MFDREHVNFCCMHKKQHEEKGGNMFGENLIKFRRRKRISQKDFAEMIGVTRQTVAKWENNESAPDIYVAKKIAEVLEVTIEEMLESKEVNEELPQYLLEEHYFWGKVVIGSKGEIKLPPDARERFQINVGDEMLVLGDIERGIELLPKDILWKARFRKEIDENDENKFWD